MEFSFPSTQTDKPRQGSGNERSPVFIHGKQEGRGDPAGIVMKSARSAGAPLVFASIRELTQYEGLLDQCVAMEEQMLRPYFRQVRAPLATCGIRWRTGGFRALVLQLLHLSPEE